MLTTEVKAQLKAIRETHGTRARYETFRFVRDVFEGQVAWDGHVNIYQLRKHPTAKRCYAWSWQEEEQIRTMTVLELPPVTSAETAVKVAIAAKARQQ